MNGSNDREDVGAPTTPDHDIAQRLRAMDAPISDDVLAALRARVLERAAPALAARAEGARLRVESGGESAAKRRALQPVMTNVSRAQARPASRPASGPASWMEATSGLGRIAIPLAVAAALIAMVVLRQLPPSTVTVASTEDTTLSIAYAVVGDSASAPLIVDELVIPQDADAVLLATDGNDGRQ
jgi:hypothetical protein